MKSLRRMWVLAVGLAVLAQIPIAGADEDPGPGTDVGATTTATSSIPAGIVELKNPLTATTTGALISSVGGFLIGISTALVVIFILWGAFQLMTSGGSPERVEKGRKTIFWAILGFVVLLVAGGVGALIADILGGTAAPIEGAEVAEAPITSFEGLMTVIRNISRWMFGILIALSIIMVLYAAFLYVLSQGSEDRIKKAKDTLTYAIIAVVVAVFAGGIGVLVQNFLESATEVQTGVGPGNQPLQIPD